jgi:hypothetical protein
MRSGRSRVCQDDLSGGVCNEVVTEDEMTRALEAGSTGVAEPSPNR